MDSRLSRHQDRKTERRRRWWDERKKARSDMREDVHGVIDRVISKPVFNSIKTM